MGTFLLWMFKGFSFSILIMLYIVVKMTNERLLNYLIFCWPDEEICGLKEDFSKCGWHSKFMQVNLCFL